MKIQIKDGFTKAALTAIVLLLGILALKPTLDVPSVQAQSDRQLFIEPGTTMLRVPDGTGQVQGKVVVDMKTGDIWGFPTNTSAPYPVVMMSSEPPVSKPLYLGKFDFAAMRR